MEEYEIKIEEFKGHPVLKIPIGGGFYLTIGLKKAKAILDYIKEIENFVESNGRTINNED